MGLIVPNIADLPRSMIVIDPKGQLAAITARKRAKMGRVIVSNAFNLFPELAHLKDSGWNSLRQPKRQNPDFAGDARCIADAILSKSAGGDNSKFFDISAENLLAVFIMAECLKERPDFNNIRLELASPSLPQTLERMAESDVLPVRVAAATRLTDKNTQNTSINDIIETVLKDLTFLDDERLAFNDHSGTNQASRYRQLSRRFNSDCRNDEYGGDLVSSRAHGCFRGDTERCLCPMSLKWDRCSRRFIKQAMLAN